MSEQTEKTSSHKTEKVVNKKTADGMDITENSVVTAVDDVTDNEPTKQKKRTGKKNIPEIKNDAAEVTQEPFNENEAKPVDNEAPEGKSVKIAARKLPSKKALAAKKTTEVPENEPEDRLLHEADFVASDTDMEEEHEEQLQTDFTELSREELVSKLEELVQSNEISKIKARVAGIKVVYLRRTKAEKQAAMDKYLADGGNKEDYIQPADTLEERFKNAFDIYKEKKVHDDARQERAKLENLEQKKQILEEIKQLISSEESLKKTYDEFKILQEKWKQIGQVPRNEIESLWNNYHYLVDKFFEKVKIGKELKDLDLKKNLEQKILLCEKVEELLFEKSITKSFKLLQKYHDEWKEIGPIPQDKKDEIWERFKTVSDKINQARREYYSKLQSEQEANLLAKTALCEKMEAINAGEIATGNDWKAKTAEVLEMQELWDSIGRTPAKFNDEIWERFRSAVNLFYNNKNEFFSQLKEQQITNYNLKLGLCVQAEAVVNNSNWKQSTAEILNLQQEWKKIGP
ncbi:MAG: DUF349 domain-containing protein, partial [Bacteroidales bacterium]|nr:DUF349 domain-containing protein [Bacteroidales bacterium]